MIHNPPSQKSSLRWGHPPSLERLSPTRPTERTIHRSGMTPPRSHCVCFGKYAVNGSIGMADTGLTGWGGAGVFWKEIPAGLAFGIPLVASKG